MLVEKSQNLFVDGISKLSDSLVLGIKSMSLRLQCEMARNICNTKFLPVIGSEYPIIVKLIRKAHEFGMETDRRLHNMEKTWFKQRQHCKDFVNKCGVCWVTLESRPME